ncbi:hypothetical protein [Roseateles flavus]|uniref:Uncharacterized protein n=1 Tax=Roseateles flavus TaxID=3149041 RepID=A0ABV0GEY3_9BURK
MKEYLVIFAQLLCVGWLLRTMSKARGKLDEEELGWFDIRLGGKVPKPPKSTRKPPAPKVAAWPDEGRGPRA